MNEAIKHKYDVFISYSQEDGEWVWNWLVPQLQREGIKVCIDVENFEIGASIVAEIESATVESRKTLLVLTPDYLKSEWMSFEVMLARTEDPSVREKKIIPVMRNLCSLPLSIRSLVYADFTSDDKIQQNWPKLLRSLVSETLRMHKAKMQTADSFANANLDIKYADAVTVPGREKSLFLLEQEIKSLKERLDNHKLNLLLVEDRISEFVLSTDVSLGLIKQKRVLEEVTIPELGQALEKCEDAYNKAVGETSDSFPKVQQKFEDVIESSEPGRLKTEKLSLPSLDYQPLQLPELPSSDTRTLFKAEQQHLLFKNAQSDFAIGKTQIICLLPDMTHRFRATSAHRSRAYNIAGAKLDSLNQIMLLPWNTSTRAGHFTIDIPAGIKRNWPNSAHVWRWMQLGDYFVFDDVKNTVVYFDKSLIQEAWWIVHSAQNDVGSLPEDSYLVLVKRTD